MTQVKTESSSLLLGLLGDLGGDSIHVGGTLLGKGLSSASGASVLHLVGDLSNETGSLELLHAESDALAS